MLLPLCVAAKKERKVKAGSCLWPDELFVLVAVALLSVVAVQPCLGQCTALGAIHGQWAGAKVQGHPAVFDTAGSEAVIGVLCSLQRFLF